MSLARIIGKLEGWKYTPLHSIVLPEGKIRDGQKFDNHGDQYICDRADALETIHVKSGDHTIIVEEQGKAAIKAQEITVEQNASLLHIRILNDGTRPYFAPVHASIARDGLYTQLTLTHGGTLMRLATQAELNGENAKADIRAIHKVSDENHIDQTILIKHMAPHCESNQNVRYVVDGEARAAFEPVAAQAAVTITPHARFAALAKLRGVAESAARRPR